MSTEREQQSHGMAWAIALLLVPVLYVLSYGPVTYLNQKNMLTPTMRITLDAFYSHLDWLSENKSLGDPLGDYLFWWIKLAA
jgi:hypothetical protein